MLPGECGQRHVVVMPHIQVVKCQHNQKTVMCRSPKPELLQLLFQHLPALAQDTSRPQQDGHRKGGAPHADGPSATANGDHDVYSGQHDQPNQHQPVSNGHRLENGNRPEANGHSDTGSSDRQHTEHMSSNSDESSGEGSNTVQQAAVHVDGQANGVCKDTACQQATKLQDLLQDEVEAYLDKRHIIDILHDFSGSHPPLASLLACLRPLQPRLYSISSSQREHPNRVQITVAVVRYKALGRDRIGVTSTFLKERMQVCKSPVVSAILIICLLTAHSACWLIVVDSFACMTRQHGKAGLVSSQHVSRTGYVRVQGQMLGQRSGSQLPAKLSTFSAA